MCTAVTYQTRDQYFGRNLDLEHSYHECIAVTPRNFPLSFRRLPELPRHHAILGVACVVDNYPLYYDAVNETGLAMAGLNFPGYAHYDEEAPERDNVTPFELIPWILGRCATLEEAKSLLAHLNLLRLDFSSSLPLTPLHWIIADRTGAITVEPLKEGLQIHDNPVGVLTNSPPFDFQLTNLCSYLGLSREAPENRFSPNLELQPYSRGMGAIGLPGDLSSTSRFVKVAFTKLNAVSGTSEAESINQLFHILTAVEQQRGCVYLGNGAYELTRYTACCNASRGIYYYTTYENRQITAVDMHREDLERRDLISYPLLQHQQFFLQNR